MICGQFGLNCGSLTEQCIKFTSSHCVRRLALTVTENVFFAADWITDQQQVTEELVEHFATQAEGIGGTVAERKLIEDFEDHPCV